MSRYTDVALSVVPAGYYDIAIGADGDIEKTDSFDTALLLSIFCERRASESEVPEPQRRRGWIGNLYGIVEYGSKLWLLYQARLTLSTVNRARGYLEQSLSWLTEGGYLKRVVVTTSRDIDRSALIADIQLIRFDDTIDTRNYTLWDNTGRQS